MATTIMVKTDDIAIDRPPLRNVDGAGPGHDRDRAGARTQARRRLVP
jgi:hypothetical protein